jgi:protein involved in polysaccharide export with SLBB domain
MIENDLSKRGSIGRESRTIGDAGDVGLAGSKTTGPQRLQRMNTNMYHSSWNLVSGSWRSRICVILLGLGLVVLPYMAHSQRRAPYTPTTAGEPNDGSAAPYQSPSQELDQPDTEMSNEDTQGQGYPQSDQESDTPVAQGPAPVGQGPSQTMSVAAQIISILKHEPLALQRIKEQVAMQSGIDPFTISDSALFTRVRLSDSVRTIATQELSARGYSIDPVVVNKAVTTGGARSTRSGTPTLGAQEPTLEGREQQAGVQVQPMNVEEQPYENPDSPQVQHRFAPYTNLPSLSDLYSQFSSAQQKLRRFGSDAFLIGSGNANELPMDLPAGPDYVLGPGDSLMLNLWGSRTGRISRIIDRQGQVQLPEAGTVMVSGMTIAQAQTAMEKVLNTQFQNEHCEISLGRVRTVRVYVVGDVQRPGAYDVSSLSTPLSALYEAGGPTSRGSLRILRQFRGKQLVREVDLYDFLLRGVRAQDERLLPGDTILVPPAGPQITVEGTVHRPAIYELNGEQGLDQILELSGGVLVSASLKQVNVERIDAHQSRTMFSLQLPDDPAELHNKLAAFKVKDGDDVVLSQIQPYNAQAVYLQGHVLRPGKFPYHEGMTIADVLRSYEDVLPEPSDHAELVRLQAPDFRPITISFNLRDVLTGDDPINLRPLDVIRVYGRYEMDSPTVSIQGEVLRPGTYPMSEGLTVTGLVGLAGGFRRSALRDEADLSSYTIQGGRKVVLSHSQVNVAKALEGDKTADATLKPGDVVSIRQLAGWQDIGATVSVGGEVMHPGNYGITDGERLSSVLKRAGGFTANAYPYAASLERVSVRELGEQARKNMIQRVESTPVTVTQGSMSTDKVASMEALMQSQRQEILTTLRNRPASGRLVIRITSDISSWENTPADIELRAGDTLVIPKRPNFVSVNGQVYNPLAISYAPGKDLEWYLKRAGGATSSANKKQIYVLRADGTVVPHGSGWLGDSTASTRMRPGDTIFVPEKIAGGSVVWQNILATAQIMSAAALPLAVAGVI